MSYLEENYSNQDYHFLKKIENMNMNKMQVIEEAAKKTSEANQLQKRSNEAEKSYVVNSNAKVLYNPYNQSYFSVNQNQTENILLQPNTEGLSSSPKLSSSFGFSSPAFSSYNCLHDQRPEEQEVYQMNPTCQTSGFYEQYDQTKTEDRNQILANIASIGWEANIEDPNQVFAYCLTGKQTGANTEDFSSSMQSGFWVDNTYYQRWSTNSDTI